MNDKSWTGIVRHFHTPNSRHVPYPGILKADDDVGDVEPGPSGRSLSMQDILRHIPDGHSVRITVADAGEADAAKGHVYMLTKAHTYERVPTSRWEESFESADTST